MTDLTKAFEVDNGLISDDVILPDSIFEAIRSLKNTYTGDLVSSVSFYNSLTQIDANRIAKIDLTYNASEFVTSQTVTYYEPDGTTVFKTESMTYSYSGDDSVKVEVS
jgi:hypothetical protein